MNIRPEYEVEKMKLLILSMVFLINTCLNWICFSQTTQGDENTSIHHKKSSQCTRSKEELLQEYREKYGREYKDIGVQWSQWAYIHRRCELRGQACKCQYGQREQKITKKEHDAEFEKRYGEPLRYGVQREQYGRMQADIEFENKCGCHEKKLKGDNEDSERSK